MSPLDRSRKRDLDRAGWRGVRSGLLTLLGGIPLAAGIFFLDALRRAAVEGPSLIVVAEEIEGLVPGADVWVAGRPAGRVTDVSFLPVAAGDPRRVAVRLVLLRDAALVVRRDAEARIGRSALLSPPVVKLRPGSRSAPAYDFSDTLLVTATPGVREFRELADSASAAAGTLAAELGRLGEEMERGGGTLPRLRRNRAFAGALAGRRQRADALRTAWRGSGLREVIADTAWRAQAAGIGERWPVYGEPPEAAPSRVALPAALEALGERSRRVTRRMEESNGTLDRLATDDALRAESARVRDLLDSLRTELRADPLRYLRFRLF